MAKKYYLIFFLAFIASTLIAIRFFYPRIYSEQYEVVSPEIVSTPIPTLIPTPKIIGEEALVESIIDGETIVLDDGRKVRYIGVNAPKLHDSSSYGYYSLDSVNENIKLVEGKKVLLIKDTKEIDDSGNLLRYVYLGDLFINSELIKSGYAKAVVNPPNTLKKQELIEAQEEAYANKLGIWQDL
jgi:micrococcal nuclease